MSLEEILQSITRTAEIALPLYQQKELMQLNIKRAEMGLPAINPQDYAAGVRVGVDDETRRLGYIVFGGLAALLLFKMIRKA